MVTGMCARYMAMALPLLSEWHPICEMGNLRADSPMDAAAARRVILMCLEDISDNQPLASANVFTGVSLEESL